MSDPAPGVTPPPSGTPAIPTAPTSDNPAAGGAPAWGQAGYGAPPSPQPRQPNPVVANLRQELVGDFPTPTDAAQGKMWAMLSYLPGVFIPLWLVPLVRRNNHLSLFHAKQMLGFAALQIPTWVVFMILNALVRGIPQKQVALVLSLLLSIALGLAFLTVAVIGLLGAMKGQVKPLPLIGRTVDRMTRGLTVCPPVSNPEPQLAYWMRVAPAAPRQNQAPAANAPAAPSGGAAPAGAPPASAPPAT